VGVDVSTKFDDFIKYFPRGGKAHGQGVMVSCPGPMHANGDRNPSLHVSRGERALVLHCFAGCACSEVLAAIGLDWDALYYEPRECDAHGDTDRRRAPAAYLDATYDYLDTESKLYMQVERWVRSDGSKTFKQRGPDGNYGLPEGFKPCLFNLPVVVAQAQAGGVIWICEGEKDCLTLRRHGLVATTNPMGAGKWRSYYWHWLQGASEIVVVADADEKGRSHAAAIRDDLRIHGFGVRCVRAKSGKDASDHFRAGFGVADFLDCNPDQLRPVGVTCHDLLAKVFPPMNWTVPGMLGPGLALLGGPPKIAKSWTALDIALAVAYGGPALSEIKANQGDVLYLSLDNDTERRLQERIRLLLGEQVCHDLPIEYHVEFPTGAEALRGCREWIHEAANPRLIVIDTFVRVEPDFDGSPPRSSAYSHSTDVLSRWARLANDNDLTVLAVHHDRKATFDDGAGEDWINRFTGSRGITAAAATLLFLDAARGAHKGYLRMTGRDVGDFDIELMRPQGRPFWRAIEPPPDSVMIPDTPEQLLGAAEAGRTYQGLHVVPDVGDIQRAPEQGHLL
jgi:hypothetical protein